MLKLIRNIWFRGNDPQENLLSDEMLDILFEDDGSHYETKTTNGVVTKICEAQGVAIIDHEIYMDLSVPVVGGQRIRLGDRLVVIVQRRLETDAWRVERVDSVERMASKKRSEWIASDEKDLSIFNNLPDYMQSKIVIGKVTDISGSFLVINDGEWKIGQNMIEDASLLVGDWLSLTVFYDSEDLREEKHCVKAVPLRIWELEGCITLWNGTDGIIQDEIYFQLPACTHGYLPAAGDLVNVTAIESSAYEPEFTWRAIRIAPISIDQALKCDQSASVDSCFLEELLKDKHGIIVERETNFTEMIIGSQKCLQILISNSHFEDRTLFKASFMNSQSNFVLSSSSFPVWIPSKSHMYIEISFKAETMGLTSEVLELDFGDFKIGRKIYANVYEDKSPLPESSRFIKDHSRLSWNQIMEEEARKNSQWILKGVQPFKHKAFTPYRLKSYPVPSKVLTALTARCDLVLSFPSLGNTLTPQSYKDKFQILLHLEEVAISINMRQYDLPRASLKPVGPYLALEVRGLAEKRPSLIPGDSVILSDPCDPKSVKYEGFVHQVLKSEVWLQFHPQFHQNYSDQDYAVSFQFNRTPMRRCHSAVEMAFKHPGFQVLFPSQLEERPFQISPKKVNKNLIGREIRDEDVEWINAALNEEQRRAVLRILEGVYRPIPYIIYGPPGTGKTVTVVEAILQIFLLCSHSRILIATPSNSSADLIAERLHGSGRIQIGDMVRLNAFNRNLDSVSDLIQPYCMNTDQLSQVVHHRIIVSTCTTTGTIYSLGLRHGQFSHVFIDEAGQVTEPESLIPIGLLSRDSQRGQIILAGDPKQLGPVLISQHSSIYGLALSLLERLALHPLYSRNSKNSFHYDPRLLTKLVRNYRSHETLLLIPSSMFYDSELIPCARAEVSGKLAGIPWLPKKGTPLVFHGVRGENFQEADSPSWFNPAEVYHVVRYLQLLLNFQVNPDEIGIIAPYRKQVEKIRSFIEASELIPVKVGSVEEFQGQERDVIIVSTTRSNGSLIDDDVSRHLGFLRSPKRFNVTITRAKALLIVVGNPHVLSCDEHWGPYLNYCVQIGAYVGCDLPANISF